MDNTELRIISAVEALHGSQPTVSEVCTEAGCSETEFLKRFRNVNDVYRASFIAYVDESSEHATSLPGWPDMPIEERFATFVFLLLDVLAERESVVQDTFKPFASSYFSDFQTTLRSRVSTLIDSADVSGINQTLLDNGPVRVAVADSIVRLVGLWLEDDSTDKERSIALIDRTIAWWADIFANPVPDTTLELLRYAVEAGYVPVKSLPFIGQWFKSDPADTTHDTADTDDENENG